MTETVKYRDLFPRKNYNILVYTEEEFEAAVLAEREACAKLCEEHDKQCTFKHGLADAIRARTTK